MARSVAAAVLLQSGDTSHGAGWRVAHNRATLSILSPPPKPSPILHPSPHMLRGRDERSVRGDRMIGGAPSILRQEDDPGPNSLPGQGPRAQRWHELSHGRSSPKSLRSHGAKLASPTTSSPDDRHRSDLRPMPHFELCGRPNRSGGPI
jgi:hypothetical protein